MIYYVVNEIRSETKREEKWRISRLDRVLEVSKEKSWDLETSTTQTTIYWVEAPISTRFFSNFPISNVSFERLHMTLKTLFFLRQNFSLSRFPRKSIVERHQDIELIEFNSRRGGIAKMKSKISNQQSNEGKLQFLVRDGEESSWKGVNHKSENLDRKVEELLKSSSQPS